MSNLFNVLFFILGIAAGIFIGVFLFNALFTYLHDAEKHDGKHLGTTIVWVVIAVAALLVFIFAAHSWLSYLLGLLVGFTPYFHVSNSETDKQKAAAFKANDRWNARVEEDRKAKEESKRQKALEKRLQKESK